MTEGKIRRVSLPLRLSPDLYERLEAMADQEERTTIQQATWLLRVALGDVDADVLSTKVHHDLQAAFCRALEI